MEWHGAGGHVNATLLLFLPPPPLTSPPFPRPSLPPPPPPSPTTYFRPRSTMQLRMTTCSAARSIEFLSDKNK